VSAAGPRRFARGARWFAFLTSAALFLTASHGRAADADANADEDADAEPVRMPRSFAERPLTLARFVLAPMARIEVEGAEQGTFLNLGLGAAFGITPDVQVEAVVAPLQLWPSATYGEADQPGPRAGVTYRFYDGTTEAALRLDATVITLPHSSGAVVTPGILIRNHARSLRVDSGIFVRATVAQTTAVGFDAPFSIAGNITDAFHLGVSTGVSLATFDNPFGLAIPFGAFAGYAVGGKDGPILDIDPFFRWPELAGTPPPNGSTTSLYQVRWFLYL
jgi:hypothetical protein